MALEGEISLAGNPGIVGVNWPGKTSDFPWKKIEVFSNTILTCTAASSTWPMTLHRFSMEEADVVSYNTSMMPGEITHRKMKEGESMIICQIY